MVDLNGHEAGNGGHSQGKPTAYRTPLLGETPGFVNNPLFSPSFGFPVVDCFRLARHPLTIASKVGELAPAGVTLAESYRL
jgi:hypothetical protein